MLRGISLGLVVGGALYGCAALDQPMSPSEFREGVKKSSMAAVESFDAARPYGQVADTLRKKANECLAVTVETSASVYQGTFLVRERSRAIYKPTVTVTKEATELTLQVGHGKANPFQKEPPDGYYILVADAVPAGRNATKLTIYRGKWGKAKDVDEAIRGWATGKNLGCPDLTR